MVASVSLDGAVVHFGSTARHMKVEEVGVGIFLTYCEQFISKWVCYNKDDWVPHEGFWTLDIRP